MISYRPTSGAVTHVERTCSYIKKEALGVVWGVEHFHLYLYGKEFTLITNYIASRSNIYGNKKAKSSARIERWVLRLQPYSFIVVYKPGATNPADYFSRHPLQTSRRQENLAECISTLLP